MVIAPRCKSPRTPIKSIIRPLEPGSVTPGAIEELSHQIESLIERGRKLRELKNSMRKGSPGKKFEETIGSAIEPTVFYSAEVDDVVAATVNASDPLFSELPRTPIVADPAGECAPSVPPMPQSASGKPELSGCGNDFEYSVESYNVIVTPRSDVSVCLRTVYGAGERVKGPERSEVAVEVWRKQSNELAAMGRLARKGNNNADLVAVECFDIWNGEIAGVVTVRISKQTERKEDKRCSIVLESLVDSSHRTSVQRHYTSNQSLDDFLVQRTITPRVPSKVPPPPPLSVVSIAPATVEDSKSEESPESEKKTRFVSDLLCRASTFAESVSSEIEKAGDAHSVLKMRMLELDALTNKLNGESLFHESISDTSPITNSSFFVPPPDLTITSAVSRPFRRRRRKLIRLGRPFKRQSSLSVVTLAEVSIELLSNGSIENARRSISALRGSLLKDVDRISAVLKSAAQDHDEDQFT